MLTAAVLLLTGCSEGRTEATTADRVISDPISGEGVRAELPDGWSQVEMPSAMRRISPLPLFTVASSPVTVNRRPRVCHSPDRILERLPADGAVIQVSSWETPTKGLPPSPRTIKLDRESFGSYECSGRSHSLMFRQNGRGIGIKVWFSPSRVDPVVRRQAVELLNSLEIRGSQP